MRHAVLVMAHGNLKVLTICMRILDSELFEFYIHIDAKTNVDTNCLLKICKHSKVFITKRIPVYWGDFTQIEAELLLLKNAVKGNYDYYHLISGADLPIKTSTQINNFFERAENNGKIFVKPFYTSQEFKKNKNRITWKYPFIYKMKRDSNKYKNLLKKVLFTRVLKIPKSKNNLVKSMRWNVYIGETWFSIPHDVVLKLIDMEGFIRKYFKDGYTVDEAFLITIVKNIPELNKRHSAIRTRYIDWKRGNPYVWKITDANELISSDCLFARKFDYEQDNKIVEYIKNYFLNK